MRLALRTSRSGDDEVDAAYLASPDTRDDIPAPHRLRPLAGGKPSLWSVVVHAIHQRRQASASTPTQRTILRTRALA
ncbi:hypothetical protein [Xanthomonas maliensis]|uniref:hypothetical protein n=1 Tax=Xanthomonas maliensis TaxID=1321368 RepID=UPI0012641213|nr:hypothetical protein [Xanthomonas maliensis]